MYVHSIVLADLLWSTALLSAASTSVLLSQLRLTGHCPLSPVVRGTVSCLQGGTYQISKFCMEPTSFRVKEESEFKNKEAEFVKTKLMTRLTYTLDEVSWWMVLLLVTCGGLGRVLATAQGG